MMTNIQEILRVFEIIPGDYKFTTETKGLINKSYKVIDGGGVPRYFLQQIDHEVFKDVTGLMNNIVLTIDHLKQLGDVTHLELVPLRKDKEYLYSDGESYWRLYHFVSGKTYFRATHEELASQAGVGFGDFLAAIANVNQENYAETIPRFHDISLRYEQFVSAKESGAKDRLIKAKDEILFVDNQVDKLQAYFRDIVANSQKRVTHNDTKLSNLIFDENDQAKLVVDYDTLMPGYYALDYGDAVRTICSTTEEDSKDIANTTYDVALIEAFTQEFLGRLSTIIQEKELTLFPMAICYMPFLMGLRMLTDYLNNDIYYLTNYSDHNIDRARNQFTLYTSGMNLQDHLNNIVSKYTK